MTIRSILLFVLAAFAEIGGAWLVWPQLVDVFDDDERRVLIHLAALSRLRLSTPSRNPQHIQRQRPRRAHLGLVVHVREFAARWAIRAHRVARSTAFVAVDCATSSGSYSRRCGADRARAHRFRH